MTQHRQRLPRGQTSSKTKPSKVSASGAPAPSPIAASANRATALLRSLVDNTEGAIAEAARRDAHRFMGRWIAFNSLYRAYFNGSECDRLMSCVTASVSDAVAENILAELDSDIRFYVSLPPGDMRWLGHPTRFRARTTADLQAVRDTSRPARERLAYLVAAVYQVRCNLFHGDKNPADFRNHELIRAGDRILSAVLRALL